MQHRDDLDSQVVIVAGASSGIGRATAIAAAAAGARVALTARNERALIELQAQIEGAGGTALAVRADLADRDAAERLMEAVIQRWGRIDALINSVGTNLARPRIDEMTPASWNEMLAANLTAAFNLTHAIVPRFRAQGGGLLIHLSSMAAKKPNLSGIAYQANKAGIVGLAHGTMEEEREYGIRTTVIFPGLTDTPLLLKRPVAPPPEMLEHALQPEDVAAACLFVLSLPPRAHVPELLIYPSRLRDAYRPN